MLSLILITVLNSPHSPRVSVSIKPQDVKALRVVGSGCMLSHKDVEKEVQTEESCAQIIERAKALKPAKKGKDKNLQGWF